MAFKATKGQGTFRIEVEPYALKNLISTLNLLDKETQGRVRDAAQPLSKRLAGQIMMFGHASPTPQTKLVLQSIVTPRDRLIRVDLGGPKKSAALMVAGQVKAAKAQRLDALKLQPAHYFGAQNMDRVQVSIEPVAFIQTDSRFHIIAKDFG